MLTKCSMKGECLVQKLWSVWKYDGHINKELTFLFSNPAFEYSGNVEKTKLVTLMVK